VSRSALLLLLWAAPALGQAGTEGSLVVGLPASTRSAALGGAGVALVGDAGAIFSNPAGIATVRHLAVEAGYQRYLMGSTVSSAALALRLGRFEWGIGAHVLDYGSEDELVPDATLRRGTPTGRTFHSYDGVAVTGLVYRFGVIALGGSAKLAQQQIADVRAEAWAGDLGMAVAVFDIMAFGLSVQNLGGDLGNGYHLPRRTRAGFTMNYSDPQGGLRLLTTLELQWTEGRSAAFVGGVEGGLVQAGVGLIGRMGFATAPETVEAGRLTMGAGVAVGHLQMDYAYQAYGVLATGVHRLGLRWHP